MTTYTLKKLFFSFCFYLFIPLAPVYKFADYIVVNYENPLAFVVAIWLISMISSSISMGDLWTFGSSPMRRYEPADKKEYISYGFCVLLVIILTLHGRYLESASMMIFSLGKAYYINDAALDEESFWRVFVSVVGGVLSASILFWKYQLPMMNGIFDWTMSVLAVVLIIGEVGYFSDRSRDVRS